MHTQPTRHSCHERVLRRQDERGQNASTGTHIYNEEAPLAGSSRRELSTLLRELVVSVREHSGRIPIFADTVFTVLGPVCCRCL